LNDEKKHLPRGMYTSSVSFLPAHAGIKGSHPIRLLRFNDFFQMDQLEREAKNPADRHPLSKS